MRTRDGNIRSQDFKVLQITRSRAPPKRKRMIGPHGKVDPVFIVLIPRLASTLSPHLGPKVCLQRSIVRIQRGGSQLQHCQFASRQLPQRVYDIVGLALGHVQDSVVTKTAIGAQQHKKIGEIDECSAVVCAGFCRHALVEVPPRPAQGENPTHGVKPSRPYNRVDSDGARCTVRVVLYEQTGGGDCGKTIGNELSVGLCEGSIKVVTDQQPFATRQVLWAN
jgi:hypothetical protein